MNKTDNRLNIEQLKFSCQKCSLSELCMPKGMHADEVSQLDKFLKRQHPFQPGQHLYHAGDRSHTLYAVRSGALKTYSISHDGDEQVLGFALPGEIVGFDGLAGDSYSSNTVALQTSSVCELRFDRLQDLCLQLPTLQKQMMRLIGKEITDDQQLLMLIGQRSAEERLAAFLLSMSKRFDDRGLSGDEFNLPMSRQDIGNYLGLAIETVSRLFAHFQEDKLLQVNRKNIRILDQQRLKSIIDGCSDSICESA